MSVQGTGTHAPATIAVFFSDKAPSSPTEGKNRHITVPLRSKELDMVGVYDGLTVIELADRRNQWAGKLLCDGGARVIQIEPVEGSPGRWCAVLTMRTSTFKTRSNSIKNTLTFRRFPVKFISNKIRISLNYF